MKRKVSAHSELYPVLRIMQELIRDQLKTKDLGKTVHRNDYFEHSVLHLTYLLENLINFISNGKYFQ